MMDSDDENLSVHSAISNPSDFAEDEEVDYLALELLHHLPSEKADKLMKSLRAKEKAVQDGLQRKQIDPGYSSPGIPLLTFIELKFTVCGKAREAAPAKTEPEPAKEVPKPEEKKEEPKPEEQATVAEQVQAAAEKVMDGVAEMLGYGEQETPALDVQMGMDVTNVRSGMSGKVMQQTATDVLVKYDDGKAEWTPLADLKQLDKPSDVTDDKGAPEIKVEGAGDTKSMCPVLSNAMKQTYASPSMNCFAVLQFSTLNMWEKDLVARNRSLLNSCEALDDENQALTERLKEAEDAAAKERGKEETILRLTSENHKLAEQVRRLSEGCKQMEEALMQTRKDMKRAQVCVPKPVPCHHGGSSQLDEEERLYRELQGESMGDMILQKLQEKQAEHRLKIQQALQASLAEEIGRIESWGSDVKGVLLAVDGLEAQLKHQLKEPKSKKGKPQPGDGKDSKAFNSEHVSTLSAQLLDEFDLMKRSLETVEKEQLSLEQTLRAADDSAEPVAVAFELEGSLAIAESEAEWLREHNAAWVERCQSLSLQPMLDVLMRTDSALALLLSSAPPGLIPPTVDDGMKETRAHMSKLSEQLQVQMSSIAQLQEESAALSRTVTSLQASQKAHKSELQLNVSEALKRTLATFEEPLEGIRDGLRQQSQVLVRARAEVLRVLEGVQLGICNGTLCFRERVRPTINELSWVFQKAPGKEAPLISAEIQDVIVAFWLEGQGRLDPLEQDFVMSEIRQADCRKQQNSDVVLPSLIVNASCCCRS
ncbi:unnamed protein product [Symbiodinium natans]|uniref:Uncharacterized protein n=1 Tax=Symbiodinium natans TaxID=878477 RepID=A0A812L3B2_9DINO|nr:unnamed protein product [Symbiodinium natans]